MKIELEITENTKLKCQTCGEENFHLCMDCNEETNELSKIVVNNVECAKCHSLYVVNLVK